MKIITLWFKGKYFNCDDLQIEPKPLQNPYPPIKVGVTSAESFPIIGAQGFPIFVNPSRVFNLDDLSLPINEYRKAWREAGHAGNGYVGIRIPIYLANNKQDAHDKALDVNRDEWIEGNDGESTCFDINKKDMEVIK